MKITSYGNILYIVPSVWMNNVIYYKQTQEINDNKILYINNGQFISNANDEHVKNYKLRTNINQNEIAFIIREFMLRIAEDFSIDFVIQVEYDKIKNSISFEKGVNIFKLKNFKAYANFESSERKIKDVYTMGKFINIENQIEQSSQRESKQLELTINKNISSIKEEEPTISKPKALKSKKKITSSTKRSSEQSMSSNKRGQQTPSTDDKSKSNQSQRSSSSHMSEAKKSKFTITNLNSYPQTQMSPKGLYNPSVYCFMNTCLQCLCSIPELNYYFKTEQYTTQKQNNKRSRACNAYRELILKYIANDSSFQAPNSIFDTCSRLLARNQQHDCQEFLRRFLGEMTDELNINKTYKFEDNITMEKAWITYRSINASFIDSVFTGLMRSSVICNKCGHASFTYDPFMDLSVSIKKKKDYLENCLERYFCKEKIDCEYKCEKCHKKTSVT